MNISTSHTVHKLSNEMNRVAAIVLKRHLNLSYSHFYFLFTAKELVNPTQHALATAVGYSDAAISKMTNSLKEEGFVTVGIDPTHKHRRLVLLTAKGEDIVRDALLLLDQCFSDVANRAAVSEVHYRALTEKLITALVQKRKESV